MKFSAADITAMLSAVGTPCSVENMTFTGHFNAAGKPVQLYDGSIITSGTLLTLSAADAEYITVNDTIITVDDVDYVAISKIPDGSGFIEMELTRDIP